MAGTDPGWLCRPGRPLRCSTWLGHACAARDRLRLPPEPTRRPSPSPPPASAFASQRCRPRSLWERRESRFVDGSTNNCGSDVSRDSWMGPRTGPALDRRVGLLQRGPPSPCGHPSTGSGQAFPLGGRRTCEPPEPFPRKAPAGAGSRHSSHARKIRVLPREDQPKAEEGPRCRCLLWERRESRFVDPSTKSETCASGGALGSFDSAGDGLSVAALQAANNCGSDVSRDSWTAGHEVGDVCLGWCPGVLRLGRRRPITPPAHRRPRSG